MRNTPILIPIILTICLGTLAYLLFAAFSSSAGPEEVRVQFPRVNEGYSLSGDAEPAAAAPAPDAPRLADNETATAYDRETQPAYAQDEEIANDWEKNSVARQATEYSKGRYAVYAGSFRQMANAKRQADRLRKSGFIETEVVKSTGGAYAMPLVGRRKNQTEANELLAKVKAKGYDARIVKR